MAEAFEMLQRLFELGLGVELQYATRLADHSGLARHSELLGEAAANHPNRLELECGHAKGLPPELNDQLRL